MIFPHYQEYFEPKIQEFEKNFMVKVIRINDNQFVLINDFSRVHPVIH